MSFFTKFFAGGALAAGVTYYYHIDINSQAERLSNDLHVLSQQLVASAPRQPTPAAFPAPIPARTGVAEGVKSRWNETVAGGLKVLSETDWSEVAASTFKTVQAKLTPAPAPVETVVQGRQV